MERTDYNIKFKFDNDIYAKDFDLNLNLNSN